MRLILSTLLVAVALTAMLRPGSRVQAGVQAPIAKPLTVPVGQELLMAPMAPAVRTNLGRHRRVQEGPPPMCGSVAAPRGLTTADSQPRQGLYHVSIGGILSGRYTDYSRVGFSAPDIIYRIDHSTGYFGSGWSNKTASVTPFHAPLAIHHEVCDGCTRVAQKLQRAPYSAR